MSNKTQPTDVPVEQTLEAIEHPVRQADARQLDALFSEISGEAPVMWGESLVGYGRYHYRYASGREGDFFRLGFSARKRNLVVYVMPGFDSYETLLARLGKHKTGSSCLYINKLADVDLGVLEELARASWAAMAERYP